MRRARAGWKSVVVGVFVEGVKVRRRGLVGLAVAMVVRRAGEGLRVGCLCVRFGSGLRDVLDPGVV